MARHAGTRGRLYANITSGGTAEPLAFLKSWSLDMSVDQFEVTAFEDSTKTYVSGKPDAKGSLEGFWDDATQQMFTAAVDGVARKTYLYPDINDPTKYFWGTATFGASIQVSTDNAVTIGGDFSAATPFTKVG